MCSMTTEAQNALPVTLPQSRSRMDPERMDDTHPTSRDRIMVPKGVERPDFRGPPIRGRLFGNRIVEGRWWEARSHVVQ